MKKCSVGQKTRKKLQNYTMSKKKEKKAFSGNLKATTSKINRRRRLMEESLEY